MSYDTSVPALLLMVGDHAWDYGAVATVRTLGRVGIPVAVALSDPTHPVTASRYLSEVLPWRTTGAESDDELVDGIRRCCERIGRRAVAVAGDDESAVLLARRRADLNDLLLLPDIAPDLPDRLAGKGALAQLCESTGTPTPRTIAPTSREAVAEFAATAAFPLVVKNPEPFSRLVSRSVPATTKVDDREALDGVLADWTPGTPLVVQEFLPQETSQDWYVAAVFTDDAEPAVAFSGRKLRAYPDATGVGTLSESRWHPELIRTATTFCRTIGYAGVCDMDWRFDERDGLFKLLDFNPRRGAQFRTFRSSADVDVVRALHLVQTGRPIPPGTEIDGIRHVVGILDQKAYWQQRAGGTAAPVQGRRTERSWWAADDPRPGLAFAAQLGPIQRLIPGGSARGSDGGQAPTEPGGPGDQVAPTGWRQVVVTDPAPRPFDKPGPPRPVDRWSASVRRADHETGSALIPALVTVASTSAAVAAVAHEAAACRWATSVGVPAPEVLASGAGWAITRRYDLLASEGEAYVTQAMSALATLRAAQEPPPTAVSQWSGSRRDLAQRIWRGWRGGLPLREFRSARAAAAHLPDDSWIHGDFSDANCLHTTDGITVIDWEFVGRGPLGTDEVRLWSTLAQRADRDLVITRLIDETPTDRHGDLAVLLHWLALRQLAENLAAPVRYQSAVNRDLAHVTLAEARQWCRRLRQN